ncbi:MAG TPA: class I adenylate-forming enzyme family protein [Acidimicrobiia bacterium]|nr:class I adenylate-forming enzyme family protein [Acidimicrobiia bacterium]
MTLGELLVDAAGPAASEVVVYSGSRELTRGELSGAADRIAAALRSLGAPPGTAIAVMLSGPEAVAALFGVWRAGLVHVPLNPRLTDAEVTRVLARVPVAAMLTAPDTAGRVPAGVPRVVVDETSARLDGEAPATWRTPLDADAALVQLTSGTTGPPKPVVLHHGTVLALMDGVLGTLRAASSDRRRVPMANLVPLSLSVWAGIYNVCFAFRVGAPVVLLERFEPRAFAALVAQHEIRSVVLPPAAMAMLVDDVGVESLAPLRLVRSITAPLSPFQARRFRARFGIDVLNSYGQTELGGEVIGWSTRDLPTFAVTKLGAVGRPHPGVELRIVDGELQVRTGGTVGADATGVGDDDRLDPDGWFRTGDLARIDEDGFVWIEGRTSEMINRGGLKVYPAEVEEVLRAVPGVVDAAVVGVPDDRLGEVPVAFIVGRVDEQLGDRCRADLAPYKVPVRFVAVEELPRTEVGKVIPRALLRRLTP